jgi:hypothetical protein
MAPDFEIARAAFEAAWAVFLARRSDADFEAYRHHRAFHAWKHAMWAAGCKLPAQTTSGKTKCFCGAIIDAAGVTDHIDAAHRELGTT